MDYNRTIIAKNAEETKSLGQELAASLTGDQGQGKPHIICLYGELGSGKTTFIQGVAKGLGLSSRLLSPTFIIVRHYIIPQKNINFYHCDLYRLYKQSELNTLGLSEIFSDPTAIIFIEWAERLGKLLPSNRIDIHIDGIHGQVRTITMDI